MKRPLMRILLILLFCGLNGLTSRAAAVDTLTPVGSAEIPLTILDHDTTAMWSGDTLVVVQNRFSAAPDIRFFDRNGSQVSEFTFTIPGATLINIYENSVARGSDGSLAIAGTAYSDDQRGSMFVAWVSADHKEQTVIRTSPFFPGTVTLASDGTIWLAGHETKGENDARDYTRPLVRHYDKTGKLLGSFIPWSTLGTAPHIVPFSLSTLLALKDRVLWYLPNARTYFEFSLDGATITQHKSAPHVDHDIAFVAACQDGSLFASTLTRSSGQPRHWGIFRLDPQQNEWRLIPRNEKWGRLLGCDGTRLVTTTDNKTLSWLETKAE